MSVDNRELVSIITPAYNCSSTIAETIESVLSQTYCNWEMIIVNDCSTDNTAEIVQSYVESDSRIRLINLEHNSGSYVARNTAINDSKGRYIALLDADDLWKPNKLELQIEFMQNKGIAFSFTAYEIFRKSSDKVRKLFEVPKTINYNKYLCNTTIGCLTVVVDKTLIPDFHMEKGYLEDILTWMYYLRQGVIAYGMNVNLASYRVTVNSKSGNKIKNSKRYYACLKQQPISPVRRLFCQFGYAFHAVKKRLFAKKIRYN